MNTQKIVTFTKKLAEISSGTHDKEGVDQVGKMIQKALPFMEVETYKSTTFGNLLVFRSRKQDPKKPSILLSGHSDTVFSRSHHWPVVQKGNKLYGPGVNDMKGGLAVIVYILEELHRSKKLENITFTLVPDEETGSGAFDGVLLKEYMKHDFGFVYEEGTLEATPSIKTYKRNRRALVVSRKGFGTGHFKISGPSGHSGSLSEKSQRANTILEAALKICELENIADYAQGSTINIGIITGGTTFNTIPAVTEFWHDFRVKTLDERQRVKREVESLADKTFVKGTHTDFKWDSDIPPMQLTQSRELFAQKLIEKASEVGLNIILENRAGGSDASQISMVNPRAMVLDGFGPQGENEHSKDEYLYIDSIEATIKFSMLALEQATHLPPTN